jgi:hypothetical protein
MSISEIGDGLLGLFIFVCIIAAFAIGLWELSPWTSIGFFISVVIAICKGHIDVYVPALILGSTVVSYLVTAVIRIMVNIAYTGDVAGALIMLAVIIYLLRKRS